MTQSSIDVGDEKFIDANGLKLCYQEFGQAFDRFDAPALLLIMGLGTQMTGWPDDFCTQLASAGLRVIRFDNRDVGRSSKMEDTAEYDSPRWAFVKNLVGLQVNAPYLIRDMVADALALMDGLKIQQAHVVGASMGGMIAQTLAAQHPDRVASLTSIMSTSGARGLPQGKPKVLWRLGQRPASKDPEVVIKHLVTTMRMIGSPGIQRTREQWAEQIRKGLARSYYPPGTTRQLLAIMASGSREKLLRKIECKSLVIHGDADPLVPLGNGKHTVKCIPDARLEIIPGMGHDLPPVLLPKLADMISAHALDNA